MFKVVCTVSVLVLGSLMGISVVSAQATTLKYGDIVTDEITNAEFEIEYNFAGNAGSLVVIEMVAVDSLGDLDSPELLLLDEQNELVADTANNFDFAAAILTVQLPADGIYTLLATREDGRAGESVGEFTLELLLPPIIDAESIGEGTITNDDRPLYHIVDSEADFTLTYNKLDGDFSPQVTVYTLGEDPGSVEELATAAGSSMSTLTFGVFAGGEPYVVAVERALFDFSFDTIDADFILEINPQ